MRELWSAKRRTVSYDRPYRLGGARGRFVENFGAALFECLLEVGELGELIPYALILVFFLFLFGFGAYLVGTMVYHLIFDPNAVDVASRLDALSIDPDRWIRRS